MLLINMRGPDNTNSKQMVLCFDLFCIKFLITTIEQQQLSGVVPGTSGLVALDCFTETYTQGHIYIYIYINISLYL